MKSMTLLQVTKAVWKVCSWVDGNHRVILSTVICFSMVHNLFSLILLLGALIQKRSFFIPWLVSEMFIIMLMIISFTCWTFMSFFIDLLLAIVFPVIAGLVLGLWIYLWRKVHAIFTLLGRHQKEKVVIMKQDSVRNQKSAVEHLDQKAQRSHIQFLVSSETDVLY